MAEQKDKSLSLVEYLRSLPDFLVPSEEQLTQIVREKLVLSNLSYNRDGAVASVVQLIHGWYRAHGKEETLRRVQGYLVNKQYTIIRRKDGDASNNDGSGAGRGEGQLGHIPDDLPALEGEQPKDERVFGGGDVRGQGLRLIEGGNDQGSEEGASSAEHSTGDAHRPAGSGSNEGISRRLVELELSEHEVDLKVFQKAYSGIRARVRTVEDENRFMKLATWSGTTATLGLLELVIHNIERVVAELKEMLGKIDAGIIPNLDKE